MTFITCYDGDFVYVIFHCLNNMSISEIINKANIYRLLTVYSTDFCAKFAAKTQMELDPLINQYVNNKNVCIIYDTNHPKGGKGILRSCSTIPSVVKGGQEFNAKQLAQIYNFPPAGTNTIDVATIQITGSIYDGDAEKYWGQICGIPTSKFPKINKISLDKQSLDPNDPSNKENLEATLDVQNIGAACPNPNMTIHLYNAPNSLTGFYDSFASIFLTKTPSKKVKYRIVSVSYVFDEPSILNDFVSSATLAIDDLITRLDSDGVSILAASGDKGSYNGSNSLSITYPASSTHTVACAGTTLYCPNYKYDSATEEIVWHNDNGSFSTTGGGVSNFFKQPSYQKGIVPTSITTTMATVPDIALHAGPSTYTNPTNINLGLHQSIIYKGSKTNVGGTSAVAPLVAAFLVCANIVDVNVLPYLYAVYKRNPSVYHNITFGNNGPYGGKYYALPTYDCCTGLGSFDGIKLANALKNEIKNHHITPTPPSNKPLPTPPSNTSSSANSGSNVILGKDNCKVFIIK